MVDNPKNTNYTKIPLLPVLRNCHPEPILLGGEGSKSPVLPAGRSHSTCAHGLSVIEDFNEGWSEVEQILRCLRMTPSVEFYNTGIKIQNHIQNGINFTSPNLSLERRGTIDKNLS